MSLVSSFLVDMWVSERKEYVVFDLFVVCILLNIRLDLRWIENVDIRVNIGVFLFI